MAILAQIPRQPRQAGEVITPSLDVPADSSRTVRVTLDAARATLENPAFQIALELHVLQGGLWLFSAGCTYQGGVYVDPKGRTSPPPGFQMDAGEYQGQTVRGRIVLASAATVGLIIETRGTR